MKAPKKAYQRLAREDTPNKRLEREERWLDTCRTLHGTSLESYLPLDLAKNTYPNETIDVISWFVSLVKRGITPPAHILTAVAEGFEQYLVVGDNAIDRGKEPITLDRAFKLSPKQSVGHPLKHRREKIRKGQFVYKMWVAREKSKLKIGKRISKNEAFTQVLETHKTESYTEDAMLKEYTKLKTDKALGNVFEALEEVNLLMTAMPEKNLRILEEIIKKL